MSIFDNTCDFELSLTDIQAIDELEKRFTQRDSPLLDIPYSSELCDDTEDILPRNRNRKRCYVIDSDDEDEYTGQQVSSVNTRIDKDFWREPTDSGKENYNPETSLARNKRQKHELKKKEGPVKKSRKYCSRCYKVNVKTLGRNYARKKTKQVNTYCPQCPNELHFCLNCFNEEHKKL
ncbi:unnamed protein product [Parnassius mnemosyne]|uniref:PiggyBac transposable element-derived protein 4 C-terminal zinc-ribbon domain-containing protein n=1 Tax=Parnassius mnemosyne TaxID=213953 RepID=A0AAV1LN34_9NEOP